MGAESHAYFVLSLSKKWHWENVVSLNRSSCLANRLQLCYYNFISCFLGFEPENERLWRLNLMKSRWKNLQWYFQKCPYFDHANQKIIITTISFSDPIQDLSLVSMMSFIVDDPIHSHTSHLVDMFLKSETVTQLFILTLKLLAKYFIEWTWICFFFFFLNDYIQTGISQNWFCVLLIAFCQIVWLSFVPLLVMFTDNLMKVVTARYSVLVSCCRYN